MPRPVSRWVWCKALRDQWPGDRSTRTTLLFLSTYMDGEDAVAWPSEKTLAEKSGNVERTVRRHLAKARDLGFLCRAISRKKGQGWRVTIYQANVPDWLKLTPEEEAIVASIESIADHVDKAHDVPRVTSRGTSIVPRTPSTTGHFGHLHPDTRSPNNRTFSPQQPDIRQPDTPPLKQPDTPANEVGDANAKTSLFLASKQPDTSRPKGADNPQNKSSSEVFNGSIPYEARAAPVTGRVINTRRRKDPEPESIEERERKAIVWLSNFPNAPTTTLAPFNLTAERILELRQQANVARLR